MKKLILILMIITVFASCSCDATIEEQSVLGAYSKNEPQATPEQVTPLSDITLLYYPDMDTNPITTTCLANNQLLKMVYKPLIRLDDTFKPECILAESFNQTENVVTVILKSGIKFSDGTPVTARDVIKTYKVAKESPDSPYYSMASLIKKMENTDDRTVVCTFETKIDDAAGLLDFPVMKDGQEGIGCGPYKFSEKNGKEILTANEHYFEKPQITTLHLVQTKNDDYVTTLFSAGELDLLSIPGSDDLTLTSLRNYLTVTYPSNNFIYIGVNTNREHLMSEKVRKAISSCIDRDKIASQTLVGLISATVYPFNPAWYKMSVYGIDSNPDIAADTETLKDISLKLLVMENTGFKNKISTAISENFKTLGVNIELEIVDSETYFQRVQTGDYDLYLGETAVPRTMDPTYLYSTGGSMNYCGFSSEALDLAFEQYKKDVALDSYLKIFADTMPVIPIAFKKNVMYSALSLDGFTGQTAWDSYGQFEKVSQNK